MRLHQIARRQRTTAIYRAIDSARQSDTKTLWTTFDKAQRTIFGKQRPIPDAMHDPITGRLEMDLALQLSAWANHYRDMGIRNKPQTTDAKLFADLMSRVLSEKDPNLNDHSREALEHPITADELIDHIEQLQNNKAVGFDGVPAEFLKFESKKLRTALLTVLNIVLSRAQWPTDWWYGFIVPIPKSGGDPTLRSDYRPITINSVIAKLFESIINERASVFIERTLGLSDLQGGFRRKRGTMHQIWTLNETIASYRERNKPLYLCFLDVAKAYDKADHNGIVRQMRRAGLSARTIDLIHQSQSGSQRAVMINGRLSSIFTVHTGVAQGAVLSPLVYALFINRLAEQISD